MHRALHKAGVAAAASLLLAALVLGLACTPLARATTLQQLSVAQLSRHAVAVVQGTIVSTTVRQTPEGVRTDVRLRVTRSFKGGRQGSMTVNVPGGVLPDGSRVVVSGMPAFRVGESDVVFADVFGRVIGGFQGALTVVDGRIAGSGEALGAFARRVDAALGRRTPAPAGSAGTPKPSASRGAAGTSAIAAPTITGITPASASAGTDSSVTIAGDGFGATRGNVLFSYGRRGVTRIAATSIRSWSPTSITCVVPTDVIEQYAASAGSGPVVVATAFGVESNAVDFAVPFGYGGAKWNRTTVTYLVSTAGVDTALRTSLLDAGADMWNQTGADYRFIDGGTSAAGLASDGANVISWGDELEYGVLASTYATVDGHTIREIDVRFSNAVSWGEGTLGSDTYDIQSIASHELGHWLELLDQYMLADADKIMYGYGDRNEQKRTPAPGDIAGIIWIYGGGPGPTPTPTATPSVSPMPTASPTPTPTPGPGDTGPVCAARNAGVRRGGICRLEYRVSDDSSLVVTRTIRISTTVGVVKKSWSGVTRSSDAWQSFRFRCDLRKGTYRIVVTAEDLLGHPASVVGRATLRVR